MVRLTFGFETDATSTLAAAFEAVEVVGMIAVVAASLWLVTGGTILGYGPDTVTPFLIVACLVMFAGAFGRTIVDERLAKNAADAE